MYNISELSNDEIKYICERMNFKDVRYCLQMHPKEFNKIKPGFTVKKMTDDETLSFLIKYANKPFIQFVIQSAVKKWLSEIKDYRDSLEHDGFTAGEALLKTLPDCVFCDKIELYFKLTKQEYTDDYIKLIIDALSLVKKTSDAVLEEHNIEIQNAEIERLNADIQTIRKQLTKEKEHAEALKLAFDDVNEQLKNNQGLLSDTTNKLHIAESTISSLQHELESYQSLERYVGSEVSQPLISNYQYTSIGQIQYDYNEQRWIYRLADITEDGLIVPFIADETIPHYFSNRDRLYWKNGPDTEQAIGVWNWNVSPRDTDPDKDYVETDFCSSIQLTQIVQLSNCEVLDDVVSLLKSGISIKFACSKLLFVYEKNSILSGLLCSSADFDRANVKKIVLKSSVYTLPQYIIKLSDTIELAGIRIYKYLSFGIPQSIYQVRDPYEAVKSLIMSRLTNANLREYGLSKKEVQHCRNYLTAIPTQTIIQELTLAYNCSKETAQEYIDGFISLADTYLSSSDLDTTIISRALQGNTELLDLCKQQLTDEWKVENEKQLAEAESKLKDIINSVESKQDEIKQLEIDKDRLSDEMEQLQSTLSRREQLALDVEAKISMQIEKAKQNAADFISNMAFVSPLSSPTISTSERSSLISVFNSHIDCVEEGEIEDIDTFEDEFSDNLTLIGYDNEKSIEISQAISFGIFEKAPLVISENAKPIAQCLAAVLNGGNVSEIFIPIQGISIEELSDAINDNVSKVSPMVCLIHGIFDSFSINIFNALSNIMQNWDNVFILLSLEGTPSKMIIPGVWNRAIFVDGDSGFEKKAVDSLHSFTVLDSFTFYDRTIDMKSKSYKDARKATKLFTELLSNTQIGMYSRYLSIYNTSLNYSDLILTQLITTARSIGNTDRLKELFHENGIGHGEELLNQIIKG